MHITYVPKIEYLVNSSAEKIIEIILLNSNEIVLNVRKY